MKLLREMMSMGGHHAIDDYLQTADLRVGLEYAISNLSPAEYDMLCGHPKLMQEYYDSYDYDPDSGAYIKISQRTISDAIKDIKRHRKS